MAVETTMEALAISTSECKDCETQVYFFDPAEMVHPTTKWLHYRDTSAMGFIFQGFFCFDQNDEMKEDDYGYTIGLDHCVEGKQFYGITHDNGLLAKLDTDGIIGLAPSTQDNIVFKMFEQGLIESP